MSIPFLEWGHIYDNKTWILYAWLLKKTHNRALSKFLIHRLSSQFVLNDKKYNYNPQEWMYKWLSDPLLQKINPMYGMEDINNTSLPLGIWLLIWYDKFPINIYNRPYHMEQACQYVPISNYTQTDQLTEFRLTKYGDYYIGLLIDDSEILKINNITIAINGMIFTFADTIDIQILETIEPIGVIDYDKRPKFVKVKKLFIIKEFGGIILHNSMYPVDHLISIHSYSQINAKAIRIAWIFMNPEYHDVLNMKTYGVGIEYGEYIADWNNIYKRPGKNVLSNDYADSLLERIIKYNATIKKPIRVIPEKYNGPLCKMPKKGKKKSKNEKGWQVVGKNGKPVKRKDN